MTRFRDPRAAMPVQRMALQANHRFVICPKAGPRVEDADPIDTRASRQHDRSPLRLLCGILTSHAFKACLRARSAGIGACIAGASGSGWTFLLADGRTVPAESFDVSTRVGRGNFRRALEAFGTHGDLSWLPLACEIGHDDVAFDGVFGAGPGAGPEIDHAAAVSRRIPSA